MQETYVDEKKKREVTFKAILNNFKYFKKSTFLKVWVIKQD